MPQASGFLCILLRSLLRRPPRITNRCLTGSSVSLHGDSPLNLCKRIHEFLYARRLYLMRRIAAILVCLILGVISLEHLVKAGVLHVPSGTWASGGAMAQPRAGASAVRLQDGRVLITGGDAGAGPTATADFVATDGSTSPVPPMAAPRSSHISVALQDGRVLVA